MSARTPGDRSSVPDPTDIDPTDIRERAREALRRGDFNLVEKLLDQDEIGLTEIIENLRIYQAELEIQNDELRTAQNTAEEALHRFTTFFASIPLGELVIDRTGLILESNTEATRLFGTGTGHLRQHFLHRLVDPSSARQVGSAMVLAQETGAAVAGDVRFRGPGGQDFRGELHLARLPPVAEGPDQFVCAVVDLSERLRQETQLRAARAKAQDRETRYRVLAEYSPDWDYWLGVDGTYHYVSPACETICGHPATAFLADPDLMERVVHPEDRAYWREHLREAHPPKAGHRHDRIHLRVVRPDGEIRWIEHECCAAFDDQGQYLGRRGVNRDISGRKTAEHEVEQVSRLYATLSQSNQAMVRATDPATIFAALARIAVEVGGFRACVVIQRDPVSGVVGVVAHHGLEAETIAAMPLPSAADAESLPAATALFADRPILCEGCSDPSAGVEWNTWSAAAGIRTCAHYPIRSHGRVTGVFSLFSNRTAAFPAAVTRLLEEMAMDLSYALEHFIRQQALEESEGRYRRIVETTQEGVWSLDKHHHITHVNPALTRALGYSAREMYGQTLEPFLFPEDWAQQQEHLRRREQGQAETYERRLRRKNGSVLWGLISATPILDAEGEFCGTFAMLNDITERKQAEKALRNSEMRFRSLFEEVANIAVQGYDEERRVIFWNRGSEALYGFSAEEALGQRVEDLIIPPSMREEIQALSSETFAAGIVIPHGELELRRKDDTPVRVYTDHTSRINSDGKVELYSLDVDLTRLRQAEDRLEQAASAFENTTEDVTVTDPEGNILFVNRAFTEITGYEESEALGQNRRILQSGRQDQTFYQALWTTLKEAGRWQGEIWNRRKNGELYPAWMTIASVKDTTGAITRYVAVSSDVSQLRRSQEERDFLTYHDPLTRMPNRLLLRDRLEQAIERVQRRGGGLAVLFLDLDRFKNVNDSLGHEAGDDLLRQLAQRISTLIQGHDTLARLGGDEFVVLLEDGSKATTTRVHQLAKALATMFERPFGFENRELFLTASIGISRYPDDGGDPNELLRNAEVAMYRAKAEGRNTLQFYQQGMVADSLDRLTLENDLRGALSRQEFLLHYQPQVDLITGVLAGVEALVRWNHPERGLIPPDAFIPLAEEMGIIGDIGDWVLQEACQQMVTWHADGLAVPRMAVNLSVQQLERGVLADRVGEILERCHLPAAELELEVTESMIMRQTERAIGTLRSLRALGVAIAVDDFGTGYSSLGYIQRLPLNRLKIDRAFVKDLAESADDRTIARAIIGLAKSLGLEVIAEGVETQEQADFLRHEGCHLGQGYLFSRPVRAAHLAVQWAPSSTPAPSDTPTDN